MSEEEGRALHHSQLAGAVQADSLVFFYVQLKLRRISKPQVRDKDMGEWLCYHPTGGAITVLCHRKAMKGDSGHRNAQSLNF